MSSSSPPAANGSTKSKQLPAINTTTTTTSALPTPFMMAAMAAGAFGAFPAPGPGAVSPPGPLGPLGPYHPAARAVGFLAAGAGTPPGLLPGGNFGTPFRTPPPPPMGAALPPYASTPKDSFHRSPSSPAGYAKQPFPSSTMSTVIKSESGVLDRSGGSSSNNSSGYLGSAEHSELSSPEVTKTPTSSALNSMPGASRKRPLAPAAGPGSSSSDSTPTTTMTKTNQYKKIMKPLLERKRRARINKCLDELKEIMTAALTSQGENVSKLEKADILELTVRHLNKMQQARRILVASSRNPLEEIHRFQAGFSSCAQEAAQFLMASPGVDAECGQRLLTHLAKVSTTSFPGSNGDPASGVPMPASVPGTPILPGMNRRRSSSASSSTPLMSSSFEPSSDNLASPASRPASSMSSPEPEKKRPKIEDPDEKDHDEDDEDCETDPEDDNESFVSGRFDVKVKPVKPEPVRPPAQGKQNNNNPSDPVWRPF